ncbi:hypothetical protein HYS94_02215 [Candidatus Daviesbacteria bacterium]|nr:hypothetical protein [Candidatus Daviesbacteria bacterium]
MPNRQKYLKEEKFDNFVNNHFSHLVKRVDGLDKKTWASMGMQTLVVALILFSLKLIFDLALKG